MALHLVYGASVSLKSEMLYNQIIREAEAHPERMYVFLVPEQASLTVQKALVSMQKQNIISNIDILTFNRLSYRIFEEVYEQEKNLLDEVGKQMLLRLVTVKHKNELTVLKSSVNRPGFLKEMKSLVSEFSQYAVSPESLTEQSAGMENYPALKAKLKDISLIYAAFLKLLHENYEMSEERTARLAACLEKADSIPHTVIIADGFTGFTPPQYKVMTALLMRCPEVYVTADLGTGEEIGKHLSEESLFYMSAHMASALKQTAIEHSMDYDEITVDEKEARPADLSFLEEKLYRFGRGRFDGVPENIRLFRVDSIQEEVHGLLDSVLSDIREGLRFSDIAVIAGSPEIYREEITEQFDEAGIPCFIDQPRTVTTNPLTLLIQEIMETARTGFSFDSVVSYMKNPLILAWFEKNDPDPDDRFAVYERICEVENYALALGVRGKNAYEKPFVYKPNSLPAGRLAVINETKQFLMAPLLAHIDDMTAAGHTVRERSEAVLAFLKEIGAEETLKAMAEKAAAAGKFDLAAEYEKTYEVIGGAFKQIISILGEELLTEEEFEDVLMTGMGALKVGLIPPTKDRLVIGDLMRSRLGKVKRLYIIGAAEGQLPVKSEDGGLLSDVDREILTGSGITLSPDARQESFNADFYLYRLLTKPSEKLTLSYAAAGADNKPQNPAQVIGRLKTMYPALKEEKYTGNSLTGINASGEELLAARLRAWADKAEENPGTAPDDTLRALYSLYLKAAPESIRAINKAFLYRYTAGKLLPMNAEMLFSESIRGSISMLEKFAGCPYAHFLTYGLQLEERQEYEIGAADYGSLFHDSINRFFTDLEKRGRRFADVREEEMPGLIAAAVASAADGFKADFLQDGARNQYIVKRIERMTGRTLWALRKQWDLGDFETIRSEKAFYGGENYPELELTLPGGRKLCLQGRIDRIDTVEQDGKLYLKIIDYKSSAHELDFAKIDRGLQLQLLVYMEAAKALQKHLHPDCEIVPAGIYYYYMHDPLAEEEDPEKAEAAILKKLKLSGITSAEMDAALEIEKDLSGYSNVVNALQLTGKGFSERSVVADTEQMNMLGRHALKRAGELAAGIMEGDIAVRPIEYKNENSCTFCSFRGICGFDRRVPGYRPERLRKKTITDMQEEEKQNEVDG